MLAQGLENFGFDEEAQRVRDSLLHAYAHFATPIELFGYTKRAFKEFMRSDGLGGACRNQAWSAAALLTLLPPYQA
jgi:glycogen debranching enzyme